MKYAIRIEKQDLGRRLDMNRDDTRYAQSEGILLPVNPSIQGPEISDASTEGC